MSAFGIGVSLWSGSLALGVLSLIGAYLNPLFMRESSSPFVLPAYLIALLVLGLVLAAWRPRVFRGLRLVAWWGTALIGMAWLFGNDGYEHALVALPFLGLVWLLVHAELYIGWRREGASRRSESGAFGSGDVGPGVRTVWGRYGPMVSSFATTMWTVGCGVICVRSGANVSGLQDWMVTAAGLLGTGVLGMMLAGNLRAFRDVPETDGERLGVALWAQAGALLIATIALALSNQSQTIAWLAMGVAAIGAGRWARAKSLEGYGLVVLSIAVGRLLAWDSWQGYGGVVTVAGLAVRQGWFLLMLMGGLAWIGAAWLLRRASGEQDAAPSKTRRAVVDICTVVGVTLPLVGLVSEAGRGVAIAVVGILWALALLAIARVRHSVVVQMFGVAGLAIVSLVVCGVHLGDPAELRHWDGVLLHLHVTDWSLVMLGVGIAWLLGAWLVGTMEGPGNLAATIVMVAVGTLAAMVSLLVKGTSWGAVCVAWTALGVLVAAGHQRWRRVALDEIGQCVLCGAAGMWILAYLMEAEWLASKAPPLTHPGLWVGVGVACAMLAVTAWLARSGWQGVAATWEPGLNALRFMAGVLLLTATSYEVARSAGMWVPSDDVAQAAVLTVWWGVFACGLLLVGFFFGRGGIPIVRHLGLGLLFIAAGKLLFFDLSNVGEGWRVISFVGLGVLMLGVAVGYAAAHREMAKRAAA